MPGGTAVAAIIMAGIGTGGIMAGATIGATTAGTTVGITVCGTTGIGAIMAGIVVVTMVGDTTVRTLPLHLSSHRIALLPLKAFDVSAWQENTRDDRQPR